MAQTDNFTPDGVTIVAGTGTGAPVTAAGDASAARLAGAGLAAGAVSTLQNIAGRVFNFNFQAANGTPLQPDFDWRVRVSMQPVTAALFYNNQANPIMYPLSQTKGVVFPYTPSITLTHSARYGETALTHSNYKSYFYEGSDIANISISADFTVQNIEEGQYLMAVIQFFRSCTKMFYGASLLAGTPPPMVFLDGFGPAMLPHIPCVVTSFAQTLPNDVDYIKVPVGVSLNNIAGNQINTNTMGVNTRLPTMSQLNITLQPVYSRTNIANNFTLERFSAGGLIQDGTGSVGGFV
jgi:hypothetical protein